MNHTNLSAFTNKWYSPGRGAMVRLLWYYTNLIFFRTGWLPSYTIKVWLLRMFGAKLGKGVLIKPHVNIKYPWLLSIGHHVWIGENVWIDNLAKVAIGSHVCLSQGAMLLTGNHNYKKIHFDLMVQPITIEDGVWIGAKATVCPGVVCGNHAVLSVGAVATKALLPHTIYSGNPALPVKKRML